MHTETDTSDESISQQTSDETSSSETDDNETDEEIARRRTFAASSATEEEQRLAKLGRQPDGSKPVEVPKRVWRPKVKIQYEEPEDIIDTSEDLDWMFEDKGHTIAEPTTTLPPRNDIIEYAPTEHADELNRTIQWRDCPQRCRKIIRLIIERYFDVFAQEGMKRAIRGFEFQIDTGEIKPVHCKPPIYGDHEERVINELVQALQNKGLIEDDDGPWGSPIVLASKPNQGHVHWSQYVFRLCVSYRALNAVTRPFLFPVRRCDDAIEQIGAARFVITMDLDAGYWQMKLRESSRPKTAFFTPRGKKRWRVTPMGATNAHPAFVAMAMRMEDEWNRMYNETRQDENNHTSKWLQAKLRELWERNDHPEEEEADTKQMAPWTIQSEPAPKSAVIVDDILLAAENISTLLFYLACVLTVFQFYRVTVKLRKTRFFPKRAEFVGADVLANGNSPAQSKNEAIEKLERPILFTDLRMLIGFIGFYRNWMPLYETRISPWRRILKQAPPPGACDKETEASILKDLWDKDDRTENERFTAYGETNDKLLASLKKEILKGPVLKRPNPNRRFYVKTDWSAWAQGAVLLQADTDEDNEAAMWREIHGGQCEFDKAIDGLRLRPIKFISQLRKEKSMRHSFVGEASTGRWAFLKFKRHLIGQEFTWITDCSGVKKFFETDYEATHTQQRWKLELLRFDFTIVHRPGRMLTECDMLSRYNTWTEEWRTTRNDPITAYTDGITTTYDKWEGHDSNNRTGWEELTALTQQTSRPIALSTSNPQVVGPETNKMTDKAEAHNKDIPLWILNTGGVTVEEALINLGLTPQVMIETDEEQIWKDRTDAPSMTDLKARLKRKRREEIKAPRWTIIQAQRKWTQEQRNSMHEIIRTAHQLGAKATVIAYCNSTPLPTEQQLEFDTLAAELGLTIYTNTLQNTIAGGPVEAVTTYYVMAATDVIHNWKQCSDMDADDPVAVEEVLDTNDGIFEDCNRYQTRVANTTEPENRNRKTNNCYFAQVKGLINITPDPSHDDIHPVYDITFPLPSLNRDKELMVEATNGVTHQKSRPVRRHELMAALGHTKYKHEWTGHDDWKATRNRLNTVTPRQTWERIVATLLTLEIDRQENRESEDDKPMTMVAKVINRWTTLPEPTMEDWKTAIDLDPDLVRIKKALQEGTPLLKAALKEKRYYQQWKDDKLELEHDILYQYEEPKATKIRQLRRRLVPHRLKNRIITIYHATPLAGHTGYYKTYWRIAARYYWPNMSKEIRAAVLACGHCNAANATSHEKQQILSGHDPDEPFDKISIDIWFPGKGTNDSKRMGSGRYQKAIITCYCSLTGFVSLAFITTIDAKTAARLVFSHFIIPNGLPKTVIIDSGSEFKGVLISMCEILGVKYYTAAPENHNAIAAERFHRYLNKVQRIHQADTQSYEQWKMAALFAAYAWNASPIDGLDVIRSFAAKARTFKFPLDTALEGEEEHIPTEGEETLEHLETMFPLWFRQKTLLKILNEERRQRHREMQNDTRLKRTFEPNDIVIVRTQVKSKEGQPAKLAMRTRGPYRVIKPAGKNSYHIQRLPALQSSTRKRGKIRKEAAMRLTKVPSTIVIHKRIDSADTRLLERSTELVHNPLEKSLGLFDFGKYVQADGDKDYAFVKVNEMWDEPIDDDESDEEYESEAEEIESDEELQLEPTDKKTMKRKREQQAEITERRPATRAKTQHQEINKKELQMLHEEIRKSVDKLFIIKRREKTKETEDWHVVQVDWDTTDHTKAKKLGVYFIKYYVRNAADAKKRLVTNCRYWPLIYEIKHDGYFGQMIMVRPNKVEEVLDKKPGTRGWYQAEYNLAENGMIGPFNFTTITNGNTMETHRISNDIWKALEAEVKEVEPTVNISNLRTIQSFG